MRLVSLEVRGVAWTEKQLIQFLARWVKFRKGQQLTQAQFASALGISLEKVKRIEKGHEAPDGEVVLRYAGLERRGGIVGAWNGSRSGSAW